MKISIVFILIYVITPSWCQDETVFHCSPKPGCQIAQCDPVAVGWDRPGFNTNEHLHDKEFPITCKSKKTTKSGNNGDLLPIISRNILDISNIKSDFKELEKNVDAKMKSIHSFDKEISKIREIQNENAWHTSEIAALKQSRKEQSTEINELKKDLLRLETMNNKLLEELDKQRQTNNEMKKENCDLKIRNICYYVVIRAKEDTNYDKAVDICKKRNADIGLIRDKESYNAIIKYLGKGDQRILIWIGISIDPMTRDVTPADSFIKWLPSLPNTGISYKDYTNVILYVDLKRRLKGMGNALPTGEMSGVICEIQI